MRPDWRRHPGQRSCATATATAKLQAQADFVAWWDAQNKNKGAAQRRGTAATALTAGHDGIPTRDTLKRWRKMARDLDGAASRRTAVAATAPLLRPLRNCAPTSTRSHGDEPVPTCNADNHFINS